MHMHIHMYVGFLQLSTCLTYMYMYTYTHTHTHPAPSQAMDYPGEQQHFTRDEKRMSLPSHFRHQTRPLLDEHTFSHPQSGAREQRSPDRQLSLSSGSLHRQYRAD